MRMEETRNVYKRTTLGGLFDDLSSGVDSLTQTFSTLANTALDYQKTRAQVDAMSAPSPVAPHAPVYTQAPAPAKTNMLTYALPVAAVVGLLIWKFMPKRR